MSTTRSTDLTPARRRALLALAAAHPRPGRISNASGCSRGSAFVAADDVGWLENSGMVAIRVDGDDRTVLVLTDLGLALCREHGIPIRLDRIEAAATDLNTQMEATR